MEQLALIAWSWSPLATAFRQQTNLSRAAARASVSSAPAIRILPEAQACIRAWRTESNISADTQLDTGPCRALSSYRSGVGKMNRISKRVWDMIASTTCIRGVYHITLYTWL